MQVVQQIVFLSIAVPTIAILLYFLVRKESKVQGWVFCLTLGMFLLFYAFIFQNVHKLLFSYKDVQFQLERKVVEAENTLVKIKDIEDRMRIILSRTKTSEEEIEQTKTTLRKAGEDLKNVQLRLIEVSYLQYLNRRFAGWEPHNEKINDLWEDIFSILNMDPKEGTIFLEHIKREAAQREATKKKQLSGQNE